MAVTLTQPVAGKQPGESYSGPMEPWLVANGYATRETAIPDDLVDVKPALDPTLASNREAPGEPVKMFGKVLNFDNPMAQLVLKAQPPLRNVVVGQETAPDVLAANAELDNSTPAPPA